MRRERNPLLTAYAVLVYAFLFAPIVVLIVFSFNDSRRNIQWRGFTLDWYPRLFANDELLDALSVTLQVAVAAVLVSVILGSLIGLGLARLQSRARAGADTLLLLPMVTPEIVVGLSLLLFFLQLFDAHGSVGQLQLAHITFCISYVAVVVRARAAGMDPNLEEAARDLGASALGAFRFVTLPILAPAIAAGAMLAFALSFDDYVITTFNAGVGSSTLPLYIYGKIKFGVTPEINAISTIVVAVTAVAILIAWRAGAFSPATERRDAGDQRDLHDHCRGDRRRDPPRMAVRPTRGLRAQQARRRRRRLTWLGGPLVLGAPVAGVGTSVRCCTWPPSGYTDTTRYPWRLQGGHTRINGSFRAARGGLRDPPTNRRSGRVAVCRARRHVHGPGPVARRIGRTRARRPGAGPGDVVAAVRPRADGRTDRQSCRGARTAARRPAPAVRTRTIGRPG